MFDIRLLPVTSGLIQVINVNHIKSSGCIMILLSINQANKSALCFQSYVNVIMSKKMYEGGKKDK